MPEIDDILEDRGSRYGDFGVQAQTAQAIRKSFHLSPNWNTIPPYMREGLDLVATKISRMLCGDPMYMDNVIDILGYMTLVKTEMEKEHASIEAFAERVKATQEPMPWDMPGVHKPSFSNAEAEDLYKKLLDDEKRRNPLRRPGSYNYP